MSHQTQKLCDGCYYCSRFGCNRANGGHCAKLSTQTDQHNNNAEIIPASVNRALSRYEIAAFVNTVTGKDKTARAVRAMRRRDAKQYGLLSLSLLYSVTMESITDAGLSLMRERRDNKCTQDRNRQRAQTVTVNGVSMPCACCRVRSGSRHKANCTGGNHVILTRVEYDRNRRQTKGR